MTALRGCRQDPVRGAAGLSGKNFDPKVKTNGEDAKMKNAQGDRIVNPKNFEIDPNEDQQTASGRRAIQYALGLPGGIVHENIVDLDFDFDKAQGEECNGPSSVLGAGRQVGEHHNPGGGVRLTRLDGRRHDHSGQLAEDLHQRLTIDDMEANLAEDLTCDVNAAAQNASVST